MSKQPAIYLSALQVQNACNATGIIQSFARDVLKIREDMAAREESQATEFVNKHPVIVLYVHQLSFLMGQPGVSDEVYHPAYTICEERSKDLT